MQLHLNTYGTYLHVKDQLFEIKIKQPEGPPKKHQVAASKVKSIWVGEGIALSSDAVKLALKNNIDIVFLEWNGQPIGRVWHSKLGSTTKIRKCQLVASMDTTGLNLVKQWLSEKLTHQVNFLKDLKKHRAHHAGYIDEKVARIDGLAAKIREVEAACTDEVADQLRGWEGTAGRLYFEALGYLIPKQYAFAGRSRRSAKDPFNAFLNYGYGVLYSRVEKALMLAGLDPYVGFFHRDDYNYKSMVYDFIEPYRVGVDRVVFKLFAAKRINQAHTVEIANGISIQKEGKVLLVEKLNDHWEGQKIRHNRRNQTRANAMQQDAHEVAMQLIK